LNITGCIKKLFQIYCSLHKFRGEHKDIEEKINTEKI